MRTICRLFLGVTFGLLLLAAAGLVNASDGVGHRPGDKIFFLWVCPTAADVEAALHMWQENNPHAVVQIIRNNCLRAENEAGEPVAVPATLLKRESRSFCDANGHCLSVWNLAAPDRNVYYWSVDDASGPDGGAAL